METEIEDAVYLRASVDVQAKVRQTRTIAMGMDKEKAGEVWI